MVLTCVSKVLFVYFPTRLSRDLQVYNIKIKYKYRVMSQKGYSKDEQRQRDLATQTL